MTPWDSPYKKGSGRSIVPTSLHTLKHGGASIQRLDPLFKGEGPSVKGEIQLHLESVKPASESFLG